MPMACTDEPIGLLFCVGVALDPATQAPFQTVHDAAGHRNEGQPAPRK